MTPKNKRNWYMRGITTGCLITVCIRCLAEGSMILGLISFAIVSMLMHIAIKEINGYEV